MTAVCDIKGCAGVATHVAILEDFPLTERIDICERHAAAFRPPECPRCAGCGQPLTNDGVKATPSGRNERDQ